MTWEIDKLEINLAMNIKERFLVFFLDNTFFFKAITFLIIPFLAFFSTEQDKISEWRTTSIFIENQIFQMVL